MGVVEITDKIYEDKIMNMREGDKPWMVIIVLPGINSAYWHSTYALKTLYFLARDYPEKANYGYISTHNENLRECFDNNGIPQSIFIKDGRPYYQLFDAFGSNRYQEFMVRYKELSLESRTELIPIPYGLNIYPEYWQKELGRLVKRLYRWVTYDFILSYDKQRKYVTAELQDEMQSYIRPMPKFVGKQFLLYVLLPSLAILIPFCYLVLYRCLLKYLLCHCICKRLCCRNSAKLKED